MRDSFPRLQMMLLVALTGGFGLLASFTLLHLGVSSMALRYPLALAFAYAFFLFLIWLWLRTNAQDYLDASDLTDLLPEATPSLGQMRSGGGGDFGGGGASALGERTTSRAGATRSVPCGSEVVLPPPIEGPSGRPS